jgi:hypothetical protein
MLELRLLFLFDLYEGIVRVAEKCHSEERDNGEEEYTVNYLEVVERK